MLKSTLTIFCALTLSSVSFADCKNEAQVVIGIKSVELINNTCYVTLDSQRVSHFNESRVCPLSLGQVLSQRIRVGNHGFNKCNLASGDVLSGVISTDDNSELFLD